TRDTVLRSYEHQDAPFEKVVEQLRIQRRGEQTPLVQVLFTLQNELNEAIHMPGLETSMQQLHTGTAKFALTCTVIASKGRCSLEFEFNAELFEPATIERWLGHLETLLAGIAANPQCHIKDLPLLNRTEVHQLLHRWNATQVDYPRNALVHE